MSVPVQIGLAVLNGGFLLVRLTFCLMQAHGDAETIKQRDQRV